MSDFVKTLSLNELIMAAGENPADNFEAVYSRLYKRGVKTVLNEIELATRSYFEKLTLPNHPTIYDYLVLSLRKKDLIVTFNWDPLLAQAYKRWRKLGDVLPHIVFLHGNVDLGVDRERRVFGFISDEPYQGRKLEPTQLLYPVESKDYNSDPFIAEQWQVATDYLREAYYITIFGYSAPDTDVEARKLLLKAWQENETRVLAQFEIIDIRDTKEVEETWKDFLAGIHGGATQNFEYNRLLRHPRRSCESFAFSTLQQDPWRENPIPKTQSLDELENWFRPLLKEEELGHLSDPKRIKQ